MVTVIRGDDRKILYLAAEYLRKHGIYLGIFSLGELELSLAVLTVVAGAGKRKDDVIALIHYSCVEYFLHTKRVLTDISDRLSVRFIERFNSSVGITVLDLHNYHLVKIHGGYRAFLGYDSLYFVTVKSVIIIEKVHVAIDCAEIVVSADRVGDLLFDLGGSQFTSAFLVSSGFLVLSGDAVV